MKARQKIYDCFLFWKEFTALEIRLNELYEVVDQFVIVEFSQSHTGLPKPFFLTENLDRFSKFLDKLTVIKVDRKFRNSSPLNIAHNQRRILDEIINQLNPGPNDLILTSDSDEIVKSSVLKELKSQNLQYCNVAFELSLFHNYINNYMGEWLRPRLNTFKDFRGFSAAYRDIFIFQNFNLRRFKFMPILRINPFFSANKFDSKIGMWLTRPTRDMTIIKNAGWHFTKIYSAEDHFEHAKNSPHFYEQTEIIDVKSIKNRILDNQTSYGRIKSGKNVKIDTTFPRYIQNNEVKFSNYINKGDNL